MQLDMSFLSQYILPLWRSGSRLGQQISDDMEFDPDDRERALDALKKISGTCLVTLFGICRGMAVPLLKISFLTLVHVRHIEKLMWT